MSVDKYAPHILIIDDDSRIRDLLQRYLVEQNYFVSTAKNNKEAEFLLKEIECNLMILDLMMPDENGIELAKRVRFQKNNIPMIMLTAMGESHDRVTGLEIGADDYIVKPFEPKELLLRISKLLKRNKEETEIISFGDYAYNLKSLTLTKNNQIIFLTNSEQALLNFLSKNKLVSREVLSTALGINERSVDVQIARLRNKIEENPRHPQFLQTVRNQGYILRF
ncbi:MAG: response regulator [Pseudomonadota bacterium]